MEWRWDPAAGAILPLCLGGIKVQNVVEINCIPWELRARPKLAKSIGVPVAGLTIGKQGDVATCTTQQSVTGVEVRPRNRGDSTPVLGGIKVQNMVENRCILP